MFQVIFIEFDAESLSPCHMQGSPSWPSLTGVVNHLLTQPNNTISSANCRLLSKWLPTTTPCTTSYSQTHWSFKNFIQMAVMKRNHHSCIVKYSKPCVGWRMENHLAQIVFRQNCWRSVEWQFARFCLISAKKLGLWILARTMDIIICLFMKGDRSICENHRTISMINHSSKILLSIIWQWLKLHIHRILSQEQTGFQDHKSTVKQIFIIQQLVEKHVKRQNKRITQAFIDYKKVFDHVMHAALFQVLDHCGIPTKLHNLIANLYNRAVRTVKCNGHVEEWFRTTVDLDKGAFCPQTLLPFILKTSCH